MDEHFITTYTGKKFHYLSPTPEEIDIKDIAHALSLTCRFGGHCRSFYSVAEHSVRVAAEVPASSALFALLHDAAEAYLPDIPSPMKQDYKKWQALEGRIEKVIIKKYDAVRADSIARPDAAGYRSERLTG
jgi:5'-deoxynucleotidase YfbR-like HD superfamily hydrolase